ncbi:MAG: metal-dependent transcriptional regulator [Verrucomicrobia bacterium]|nr:metal-dependent transcriptional regulator [Verrucomicrobiota bacterium]
MISQSVENFIKNVYDLQQGEGWVGTSLLAERLGQRPASVTNMIQRLAAEQSTLVDYRPYKGMRLTATGTKVALEIIRHHRLIELYLSEALGVPWDQVHEEAEKLEHVISEDLEDRIAASLSDTRLDPHGSPIPTKDGQIENLNAVPLGDIEPDTDVRVAEVYDHDPTLLRYLGALGLYPGTEFRVLSREAFGSSLRVRVGNDESNLGADAVPHISVYVEGSPSQPSMKESSQ